jgi:hypothetical protein
VPLLRKPAVAPVAWKSQMLLYLVCGRSPYGQSEIIFENCSSVYLGSANAASEDLKSIASEDQA